jgi:FtsP/CotA-like multicopper oxidase with cupredoxin domain
MPLPAESRVVRVIVRCAAVVLLIPAAMAAETLPPIQTHDNRNPSGQLRDGVLSIRLEIGRGLWHPEAENGAALAINAFGETGKPLQNPGPLIRVPQGTEVAASVHNNLPRAVTVHGLCAHPCGGSDSFEVAAGSTHEGRFTANTPGLYYYWAAKAGTTLFNRESSDTQMQGALMVDPPGQAIDDEIFVISVLADGPAALADRLIATINGKSWPFTKRFEPHLGQAMRWRWINTSEESHAMHLHGFFYRIEATGDGEREQRYRGDERPQVVTQRVDPGHTFEMTWSPERPGRWLFHCHMVGHMVPPNLPKSAIVAPAHLPEHTDMHDGAGMGQLILGITVPNERGAKARPWEATRKLELEISENQSARPRYRLELKDSRGAPSPARPSLIGPPIVLTRGEPVDIEVVNHIGEPTAIHWHGIELESYFDGVPGWTGLGTEITPAIAPGKSFVARMSPPRAGTFIYHTHWHDEAQLTNGIYGPLVVLPPGEKFDPSSDLIFVFSMGDFDRLGTLLLINGSPQIAPLRLGAGKRYRLRLINIAPNNVAMEASLQSGGSPVRWRMLAKDGADLPPSTAKLVNATTQITVGETYDFEFESSTPQELTLDVYLPGPKTHSTQTLVFQSKRP